MNYAEKLKDPRWQKRRLEIMQRDNFQCQFRFDDGICGEDSETLHVHHSHYITGLEPWEQPDNTLLTLCETHHKRTHGKPFIPGVQELTELSEYEIEDGVTDRISTVDKYTVLGSLKSGRGIR